MVIYSSTEIYRDSIAPRSKIYTDCLHASNILHQQFQVNDSACADMFWHCNDGACDLAVQVGKIMVTLFEKHFYLSC